MVRGYTSYYMPLIPTVHDGPTERQPIYAMLPLLTQGTTAPQMPPPKINDPNMQFNWQHLVDQWPLKSNRPCSNCMHKFESIPWMIPIKRIESYYKMDDSEHVFCSYSCELRFLLQSGYPDRFVYIVYLNDIARNYFKWRGELLAAPPRLWLETMTIEEYRAVLVPPPFYEFPRKPVGEEFDVRRESRWMADMTMLRPPFLSGTAIMEWVSNVVPRAHQASKVLVDASQIGSSAMLMGPLVQDGAEGGMTRSSLEKLASNKESFQPWRVEGLSVPTPKEMEENEAHRIVLPPIDPGAPALIDEIARMRRDVASNKAAEFSTDARSSSYVQEFEGLVRSKQGKRVVDEQSVLRGLIEANAAGGKKAKGRKRARDENEAE